MTKVTYLIGAGASYYSLPLISTMNKRMKAYSQFLKDHKKNGLLTHPFTDNYISLLEEIIEIESQRTAIDAYARELSLNPMPDAAIKLRHLKAILCGYIIFEQLIKPKDLILNSDEHETYPEKGKYPTPKPLDTALQDMIKTHLDKRYITFWGGYLTSSNDRLPDNIRILSWNYDMQFEASYSQIKSCPLEKTQEILQVYPSQQKEIDIKKSCILKLNGTAGLFLTNDRKDLFNYTDTSKSLHFKYLNDIIEILYSNFDKPLNEPLFSFAWESNERVNKTRQLAAEVMKNTQILVIIGYSFPIFNKEVDRQLFSNYQNIERIYYQAPSSDVDNLIDKLIGIDSELSQIIKRVTNLDTFFIPPEL